MARPISAGSCFINISAMARLSLLCRICSCTDELRVAADAVHVRRARQSAGVGHRVGVIADLQAHAAGQVAAFVGSRYAVLSLRDSQAGAEVLGSGANGAEGGGLLALDTEDVSLGLFVAGKSASSPLGESLVDLPIE